VCVSVCVCVCVSVRVLGVSELLHTSQCWHLCGTLSGLANTVHGHRIPSLHGALFVETPCIQRIYISMVPANLIYNGSSQSYIIFRFLVAY